MVTILSPILALCFALNIATPVFAAPMSLSMQSESTAQTLEARVAERKATRVRQQSDDPQTSEQPRTGQERRRASAGNSTSQESSLMQRREQRRKERLSGAPLPLKLQVVDGVNFERAKVAIAPLRYQALLETAAQDHAQDMHNRDYFAHENPEGLRSSDRIKKTEYGLINVQECRCNYRVFLGENIAKGQTTVEQVIREWMASPSHREAMLSRDYSEIGVGIVDDIWVLNFGSIKMTPMHAVDY